MTIRSNCGSLRPKSRSPKKRGIKIRIAGKRAPEKLNTATETVTRRKNGPRSMPSNVLGSFSA